MEWLKKLFGKAKSKTEIPPMPSWEEIIEIMYDKSLEFSNGVSIIRVIYSNDKDKRYILFKSDRGFYKYIYQEIRGFTDYEWPYLANLDEPAFWQEVRSGAFEVSIFGTEEEAMKTLVSEPNYLAYFIDQN